MLDGPARVRPVDAALATAWRRPAEELWRTSRENLAREWAGTQTDVRTVGGGAAVRLVTGPSPFVGSLALRLEDLEGVGAPGAIVAVPHQQVLVVHAVGSETTGETLRELAGLAAGLHAPGPGALHPGLFWWRRGAGLLPVEPERLARVLAAVSA